MSSWDPKQYLKFENERTQPSIDLTARIGIEKPGMIIDIGCGPGNSTAVLKQRWPNAQITGLDNSIEMIKKAGSLYPEGTWVLGDIVNFKSDHLFDIVFSNATLQWIHSHEVLLPKLFELVSEKGVLAVQVPANGDSPLYQGLLSTARTTKWSTFLNECEGLLNYRTAEYYYPILASLSKKFDLWQTIYYHKLLSHRDLIEWYRGTGMKPYLDKLDSAEARNAFEKEILERCVDFYPLQKDGTVLYPFKRTFFIIKKNI